jgi:protease-4
MTPMTPKRRTPWAWIIISISVAGLIGLVGMVMIVATIGGVSGDHVGLVSFSGQIMDQEQKGLFGSARGPRDFIADCESARRDKSVKAVVIRINSPGGSAAASEEMYRAIRRLREKKPVVCSMGDVAASGGYYMASACDKIYANPATITASIGVISQFVNMETLFKKLGVDAATLKSGQFKDAGSPFRKLRPNERQLFQAMIVDIYNTFVDDVVAGRKAATKGKLTRAALLKIADGRVVTGNQAKKLLLVDALGGLHEAVEDATQLGGLKKSRLREVSSGGGLSGLLGDEDASTSARGFSSQIGQGFNELMQGAGSAFARGFAQTFVAQMRAEASTQATPQTR